MTDIATTARALRALSHELLDGWIAEDGSKATTDGLVGREVSLVAACETVLTGTPVDPADYIGTEYALMESDEASRMIAVCEDLDPGAADDEIVVALSAPLLALARAMRG